MCLGRGVAAHDAATAEGRYTPPSPSNGTDDEARGTKCATRTAPPMRLCLQDWLVPPMTSGHAAVDVATAVEGEGERHSVQEVELSPTQPVHPTCNAEEGRGGENSQHREAGGGDYDVDIYKITPRDVVHADTSQDMNPATGMRIGEASNPRPRRSSVATAEGEETEIDTSIGSLGGAEEHAQAAAGTLGRAGSALWSCSTAIQTSVGKFAQSGRRGERASAWLRETVDTSEHRDGVAQNATVWDDHRRGPGGGRPRRRARRGGGWRCRRRGAEPCTTCAGTTAFEFVGATHCGLKPAEFRVGCAVSGCCYRTSTADLDQPDNVKARRLSYRKLKHLSSVRKAKHGKAARVYSMLSDVSACHADDDSVRWRCSECSMGILHADTAKASQATVRLHIRGHLQHDHGWLESRPLGPVLAPDECWRQHFVEKGLRGARAQRAQLW